MIKRRSYNPYFVLKGMFSDMLIKTGLLMCCLLFSVFSVKADDDDATIDIEVSPIISYDEVSVDFDVDGYLKFETDVIITESNKVYINIEELFSNLGIKCVSENSGNYLSGFIEHENRTYSIDFDSRKIKIGDKTYHSSNGIVEELGAIYVDAILLTEAFGLTVIFNFRSLSLKMEADFELPLIKKMRLEQMRQNISKLQDVQIVADTVLERDYHLLKFGMVDWFVSSLQGSNGISNNRVALGAGAELLYGQANVLVYYDEKQEFDKENFYYNWRWVDNEKSIIRQAQLGKIYTQSIAFVDSPVVGASVSNTPTTVRKASGYYTINEYTEPNWTVELYINDVLVDYTVADASGLFVFKVPIVYGYTTLKLKFYGPLGEERIDERNKNVPFTFMSAKTLEYNVSGGVLQDNEGSKFGKGVANYGITNFMTVGGGMEYLSSISNSPFIPFATVTIQPFSKMVMNLEYSHSVRTRALLNYYFGKSAFLEIDYADYVDGQLATRFNADEELKVRFSLPFKMEKVSGYAKLNYQRFAYSDFTYNYFDVVLSGYYKNLSANLSTLVNWVTDHDPYITSNLSLSYRLRSGFIFRPSVDYHVSENRLARYRVEVEKRVSKMYFSIYYERDVISKVDNVFLSFSFDLPFARAGVSASYANNDFYFTESAQGSLAFGGDNYVKAGNTSAVGRGGILLYPFLDLNNNGTFDEGEKMVMLTDVRVSGAKAIISERDSIVRISDLNAFIDYTVQFSDNDLDNIAWQFKYKTYQILVDPNQYKKVYVPILSVGEVSGMVYLNKENSVKGLGRITIQIIDKQGTKIAETLSESDGYFSYLGLKPGAYTVRIDEQQLTKLDYQSVPVFRNFVIKELIDGDIVEGIDFMLQSEEATSSVQNSEKGALDANEKVDSTEAIKENNLVPVGTMKLLEKSPIKDSLEVDSDSRKSSTDLNDQKANSVIAAAVLNKKSRSNINSSFTDISTTDDFFYTVQIGVFRKFVTAEQLKNLDPIFYEVMSNGTNRYLSGKCNTAEEAKIVRKQVIAKGLEGAFIVSYRNGKPYSIPGETNINRAFVDISTIDKFFYTVQIGVYRNYVTADQLKDLTPIFYEILPNGTNRYLSGKYKTATDAKIAKKQIVGKGVKEAFVRSYKNGEKFLAVAPILRSIKRVWFDEEIFYRTYPVLVKINDKA